jgi:site-specific recombinase XerD
MTQDNTTLDELLAAFEAHLKRRDRSAHTIVAYLADVRQFAAWFADHAGEPFALDAVDERDVQDWRDQLAHDAKPTTVNRKLASLSMLYRWAGETRQIERDPTRYVNGLKETQTAPKAISKQNLNRILRQARKGGSKRDVALLEFLAATGLRASEVAGVKIGDLELGERSGWVTVRATKGKGRKERQVPVNARARGYLVEYLAERAGPDGELAPEEPLFLSQVGTAATPYVIWYTVKKYAGLAKVEDVSPHSFRHTVATRLVRDPEVDLVTAATYLGHSRLDTTMQYSRPSEEDLEAASERLGR